MRLLRLRLENVRSHAELDLDLSGVSAAAIVGRNGAGKSTLLDAGVYWTLYGTGGAEEHLREGSDRMRAVLEVEQAGSRWRITRGRERGRSTTLTLERKDGEQWTALTQRTLAETQRRIQENLTGMDDEAFAATVYAPQGQAGQLADLTPAKRKELLGALLGLDVYEDWREQAAGSARVVRGKLAILDARTAELAGQIDELAAVVPDPIALDLEQQVANADVDAAQQAVEHAQAAQEARAKVALRQTLQQQLAALRERAERSKVVAGRQVELAAALAGADAARARFDELDEHRRTHDAKIAAHKERAAALQRELDAARERHRRARRALDASAAERTRRDAAVASARGERARMDETDARCPTCDQPVHDEAHDRVRAALDARIADLVAAASDARSAQEDAEVEEHEASLSLKSFKQIPPPATNGHDPGAWQAARDAIANLDRLAGERAALGEPEDMQTLRNEYREVKARIEELPASAPDAPTVAEAQAQLANANTALREVETRAARAAEQHKTLDRLLEQRDALTAERPDLEQRAAALDVATRAFSRDGVPALILDNAVGAIEAHANDLLEQLDTPLRVRLETQRTTKTGSAAETLDIVVSDGTSERSLSRYSGGERYRVHLALRIGLAHTIAGAGGPRCDILLLDEVTDLDADGIARLGEVLAAWPGQVLIVSHNEQLSRALPTRIRVTREEHAPSVVELAA